MDYTLAKAYRALSLTSFLLKTLERLCDRFIRENILLNNPIHSNQHAYCESKSTESALHSVVSRISRSFENKASTLAAFLDIEGAFDKTTFPNIAAALQHRGLPQTISEWISNMLQHRTARITMGDTILTYRVAKGCPQGGVLSPLLWNLVVDDLIRTFNNQGLFTLMI